METLHYAIAIYEDGSYEEIINVNTPRDSSIDAAGTWKAQQDDISLTIENAVISGASSMECTVSGSILECTPERFGVKRKGGSSAMLLKRLPSH
jgi:hypothetical protein